jgi:hypothetical protein
VAVDALDGQMHTAYGLHANPAYLVADPATCRPAHDPLSSRMQAEVLLVNNL